MAMLLGTSHDDEVVLDDDFGCSLLAPISRDETKNGFSESVSLLAPMSADEMTED